MRKSIPVKTLRKLMLAAAFPVLLVCLTTPSFAARRKHAAPPPPAPVVAPPESGISSVTLVLLLVGGGLGVWVFFLKKEYASTTDALNGEIRKLSHELEIERSAVESTTRHMDRMRSDIKGHSHFLALARKELDQAGSEITKLKTRLENMLLIDPEIETKATTLAKARAKAETEEKQKEELLAISQAAQAQGKAQLDKLLSDMRRGF